MNENSITRRLLEIETLLEKAVDEVARLDEAHVRAKQAFEVSFARAFLTSEHTSDGKRRAEATLQAADEKLAAELAERVLRSCNQRIRKLEKQLSIAQSIGAIARAEMSASGWTAGPS